MYKYLEIEKKTRNQTIMISVFLHKFKEMNEKEKTSILLYSIGALCCFVCLVPLLPYLRSTSIADMCSKDSNVHLGIQSGTFRESLMICSAMIFPMFIDLVLDSFGFFFGAQTNAISNDKSLSTRWALILSSLLGDFLNFFLVMPTGHSHLMWTIHIMRETIRIVAIYDFLQKYGWKSDAVLSMVKVFCFAQSVRIVGFSLFDYQTVMIWNLSLLLHCIFFILLGNVFMTFYLLLRSQLRNITMDEYHCFMYITIMVVSSTMSIIMLLVLKPMPVCELDGTFLAVQNYHSAGVCFLLAVFHSRRSKLEMENTHQSLEMKRTFVRYVSHEIRTPLNTVVIGLSLIQSLKHVINDYSLDIKMRNVLLNIFNMADEVKESCDVAVDILNELLLYEKLEGGILLLEKTFESAYDVINDAVKTFQIQAKGAGLILEITYDDIDNVTIEVDKPKISQVLRNLVSNAIKFSPFGSVVSVHTTMVSNDSASSHDKDANGKNMNKHNAQFLRVTVKDSGAGISAENQKKLFKNIIQFHSNKLQEGKGSGLGLYISKGIVDLHGGRLQVHSDGEDMGSLFHLDIAFTIGNSNNRSSNKIILNSYNNVGNSDSPGRILNNINKNNESQSVLGFQGRMLRSGRVLDNSPTPKTPLSFKKLSKSNTPSTIINNTNITINNTNTIINENNGSNAINVNTNFGNVVTSKLSSASAVRRDGVSSKLEILIVDDSIVNRRMMSRLMIMSNLCDTPSQASDGDEAAQLVIDALIRQRMNSEKARQSSSSSSSSSLRRRSSKQSADYDDSNSSNGNSYMNSFNGSSNGGSSDTSTSSNAPVKGVPDIVLIDYIMPKCNGPEAARLMRDAGYKGLIIGVTGNALPLDIEYFLDSGANAVLTKPIDTEKLKRLLGN